MLELAGRFIQRHGLVLLCFLAIMATIWLLGYARLRRIRARERAAREVEDALLQNAQGLILHVHGIVKELAVDHPTRQRMERALDRADERLSEDRARVQDLRMQDALECELANASGELSEEQSPDAQSEGSTESSGWRRRVLQWIGSRRRR